MLFAPALDQVRGRRMCMKKLNARVHARMTFAPRRQQFAVMLSRFFVIIENARIAAVATAIARIGLDRRDGRRIITQQLIVRDGCFVVHEQTRLDTTTMVARHPHFKPNPRPQERA
jgi:hypothetical protein